MKQFFILSLVLISVSQISCAAELKKWKDENGKTHYGTRVPNQTKSQDLDLKVSVVKGASQQTKVILYSTSWCGYCKKARAFMQQENISFDEYDIEKNSIAKRNYERAGGRGVPLLIKGKESLQGFSLKKYQRFFDKPRS